MQFRKKVGCMRLWTAPLVLFDIEAMLPMPMVPVDTTGPVPFTPEVLPGLETAVKLPVPISMFDTVEVTEIEMLPVFPEVIPVGS